MGKKQEKLEDTVQQENYDSCHKETWWDVLYNWMPARVKKNIKQSISHWERSPTISSPCSHEMQHRREKMV